MATDDFDAEFELPDLSGLGTPVDATPGSSPPDASQGTPARRSAWHPTVESALENAAREHGVDRTLLDTFTRIESGGRHDARTGSYKGLFQLSDEEFTKHGGQGDPYDPNENARAGARKIRAETDAFTKQYGRQPTAAELYMIHQQGVGGAAAHWGNPDAPAWQNMFSTGEGQRKGPNWAKRAIWGNIPQDMKRQFGSVDNVTSRDFTDMWAKKVGDFGGPTAPTRMALGGPVAPKAEEDSTEQETPLSLTDLMDEDEDSLFRLDPDDDDEDDNSAPMYLGGEPEGSGQKPDLSAFGTPVKGAPKKPAAGGPDLSSFGTKVGGEKKEVGDGFFENITNLQQYKEFVKGIVPGAVSLQGTALQAPDVVALRGQLGAAAFGAKQLEVMDRVDRGESVPETDDAFGYQHMAPADRAKAREDLIAAQAAFNPTPIQQRPLFKAGEAVQEYSKTIAPPAEGYEKSRGRQWGEGLGSMVGGLPYAALGTAPAGLFFGAAGIGEATQRAVEFDKKDREAGGPGLSQEQITLAGLMGIGPGATDLLPIEVLMGRLPIPVPQAMQRPLAQAVARIGGQAFVEGLQEGGQQFLQNLIAREVYNPDQSLSDEVLENTEAGGAVGAIAQGGKELVSAMLRRLAGGKGRGHATTPASEPEQPQKALPAPESQPDAAQPPGAREPTMPPPATADEAGLLRAQGWSETEIAEMDPAERAAAVEEARAQGLAPVAAPRAPDAPSAEPLKDLIAQAKDFADPKNPRQALYLPGPALDTLDEAGAQKISDALGQKRVVLSDFDGQGGALIVPSQEVADLATQAKAQGADLQTILGVLTGAGTGKPANGNVVVQQRTKDGAVARETLTTPEGLRQAKQDFAAPGRTVQTLSPQEAIARREQALDGTVERREMRPLVPGQDSMRDTWVGEWKPANGEGTRAAPVRVETAQDVEAASRRAVEPTEGQREQGNYQKGHLRLHDLDISIETPKGAMRRGKGWENQSPAAYGYIRGVPARSSDKEHVDVYVGDEPQSQRAFIVNQVDPKTGRFDEAKIILGVRDAQSARAIYDAGFSDGSGSERGGSVIETSVENLRDLLDTHDFTKPVPPQPLLSAEEVNVIVDAYHFVNWVAEQDRPAFEDAAIAGEMVKNLRDEHGVRIEDFATEDDLRAHFAGPQASEEAEGDTQDTSDQSGEAPGRARSEDGGRVQRGADQRDAAEAANGGRAEGVRRAEDADQQAAEPAGDADRTDEDRGPGGTRPDQRGVEGARETGPSDSRRLGKGLADLTAQPGGQARAVERMVSAETAAALEKGKEKARAFVLDRGKRTGTEYGAVVLPNGKIKHNKVVGTQAFLKVDATTAPDLYEGAPKSADFHHNHPKSTSFSRADYTEAAVRPAQRRTWVHGHDGSEYWASFNVDADAIGKGYDIARATTEAAFDRPGMQAFRYRGHLIAEMLRDAGLIEYGATLTPVDAQERVEALRDLIGEKRWNKTVEDIADLKETQNVHDRGAGSSGRRPDGVATPPQSSAATRPEPAGSEERGADRGAGAGAEKARVERETVAKLADKGGVEEETESDTFEGMSREGFAREQAIERSSAAHARRASVRESEALAREDRLGREAEKLTKAVAKLERKLLDEGVAPTEIVKRIKADTGATVSVDDIGKPEAWWRLAPRPGDRYSKVERDLAAQLYREGRSIDDIVAEIERRAGRKVSIRNFSYLLAQSGQQTNRNAKRTLLWPREANVVLARLYKEGAPPSQIVKALTRRFQQRYDAKIIDAQIRRLQLTGSGPQYRHRWQPEAVELLRELQNGNLSAAQIADRIQKETGQVVTRNSVIGMTHRLREERMRAELAEDLAKETGEQEEIEQDDYPRTNAAGFELKLAFKDKWGNPRFNATDRAHALGRLREIQTMPVKDVPWSDLVEARRDIQQITASLFYFDPKMSLEEVRKYDEPYYYVKNPQRTEKGEQMPSFFRDEGAPDDLKEFAVQGKQALDHLLDTRRAGVQKLMLWGSDGGLGYDKEPRRRGAASVAPGKVGEKMPSGFYFMAGRKIAEAPDFLFNMHGQAVINWLLKKGVSREEINHFGLQEKFGQKPTNDKPPKVSREEFQKAIAERMFDFRRKVSWLNPEISKNDYGETDAGKPIVRAFRGPRIPGRGVYFERLMAFPKKLKGGEEFAPGNFESPHWQDQLKGTWASWRGSVRDVPGWGRMVVGEEGQTDYMQGANARSGGRPAKRPRVSGQEYLGLKAQRAKYEKVMDEAYTLARDIADIAHKDYDMKAATRSDLAPAATQRELALDTWKEAIAGVREALAERSGELGEAWISETERKIAKLEALRTLNEEFFAPGANAKFAETESNFTPESPLDARYVRTMVRDLLLHAAKEKADSIAVSTTETNDRIQNNTFTSAGHFYDAQLKTRLERELRQLTGDFKLEMERVLLPKAQGHPRNEKAYSVWAAKLSPEVRAKIAAEGQSMFNAREARRAKDEENLTNLIERRLKEGKPTRVRPHDIEFVHQTLEADMDLVPEGASVLTLSEVAPNPAKGDGAVKAYYLDADGKRRSADIEWARIKNSRALFLRGARPMILINHLGGSGYRTNDATVLVNELRRSRHKVDKDVGSRHATDDRNVSDKVAKMLLVADGLRADFRHELVHLLRQRDAFDETTWRALVDHANSLGVMGLDIDLPASQRVMARDMGLKPDFSLEASYRQTYARYSNIQELLDQEAACALVELSYLGSFTDEQLAPVRSIIDALNKGDFKGRTGAGAGMNGPLLSGTIAAEQRREFDRLGYYSQALEAAKNLRQAKGTPEQMRAQLRTAGAKETELAATGLDAFLKDKSSVTRDEIAQYLRDNRVEVREGKYGDDPIEKRVSVLEQSLKAGIEFERRGPNVLTPARRAEIDREIAELRPTIEPLSGRTRWSSHSIDPSNPTYRETVIHLPTSAASRDEYALKRWEKTYSNLHPSQKQFVDQELAQFTSGHWSEPNVIAHARTSLQKDSSGKSVFLIDELQSDWGQKLRDGGAWDEAKIAELKTRRDAANAEIAAFGIDITTAENLLRKHARSGGFPNALSAAEAKLNQERASGHIWPSTQSEVDTLRAIVRKPGFEALIERRRLLAAELRTAESSPSGHPLVNTTDQWTTTAFRRLVRQAVEAGVGRMALPTAEAIETYGMGGGEAAFKGNQKFYGEIAPRILGKLLAKMDSSVKMERIPLYSSVDGREFNLLNAGHEKSSRAPGAPILFHTFPLTEKIKRAVMEEGMPLFAIGGSSLDMSSEARKARAEAMGFDTSKVWYHSAVEPIDAFKPHGKFMGRWGVSGISLTDNPEMANRYLDRYGEFNYKGERFQKNVMPLYVKRDLRIKEIAEPLKQKLGLGFPLPENYKWPSQLDGYDAVLVRDAINGVERVPGSDAQLLADLGFEDDAGKVQHTRLDDPGAIVGHELILRDPAHVRSVSAAFDPSENDSARLMASSVPRIDTANQSDLASTIEDSINIVNRIAGPGVSVRFQDAIAAEGTVSEEQRAATEAAGFRQETVGGFYQRPTLNAAAIIGLATNDPSFDLRTTAGHEAWHHVEEVLATPAEKKLLASSSEMQRMRSRVAQEIGLEPGDPRLDAIPAAEIRAIAFQRYRREREEGMQPAGFHIGVRRFWDRVLRIFAVVKNALSLRGIKTYEDVFEKARTGEMVDRRTRTTVVDKIKGKYLDRTFPQEEGIVGEDKLEWSADGNTLRMGGSSTTFGIIQRKGPHDFVAKAISDNEPQGFFEKVSAQKYLETAYRAWTGRAHLGALGFEDKAPGYTPEVDAGLEGGLSPGGTLANDNVRMESGRERFGVVEGGLSDPDPQASAIGGDKARGPRLSFRPADVETLVTAWRDLREALSGSALTGAEAQPDAATSGPILSRAAASEKVAAEALRNKKPGSDEIPTSINVPASDANAGFSWRKLRYYSEKGPLLGAAAEIAARVRDGSIESTIQNVPIASLRTPQANVSASQVAYKINRSDLSHEPRLPIVVRHRNGSYSIHDGNHRVQARAYRGFSRIRAHVLDEQSILGFKTFLPPDLGNVHTHEVPAHLIDPIAKGGLTDSAEPDGLPTLRYDANAHRFTLLDGGKPFMAEKALGKRLIRAHVVYDRPWHHRLFGIPDTEVRGLAHVLAQELEKHDIDLDNAADETAFRAQLGGSVEGQHQEGAGHQAAAPEGLGSPPTRNSGTVAQNEGASTPSTVSASLIVSEGPKSPDLDMSLRARKARAEAMGFDTSKVWYRGRAGETPLQAFDVSRQGYRFGDRHRGIFLSSSYGTAEGYARHHARGNMLERIEDERRRPARGLERFFGKSDPDFAPTGAEVLALYVRPGRQAVIDVADVGGDLNSIDLRQEIQRRKDEGYDSVVVRNSPDAWVKNDDGSYPDELVVFDPANIRSVNAAFDPAQEGSPVLMASLIPAVMQKRAAKTLSRAGLKWDAFRVGIQDKVLPIRRVQEAKESQTGTQIPINLDTYIAEALYHGRAGERLTDLQDAYVEPLIETLRKADLDMEQLGDYLYARHAKERNAAIAKIDPINTSGSGMADAEATRILDGVRNSGKQTQYQAAAGLVDTMLDESRKTLLKAGLIDRETYDNWSSQYAHYVPLRGWESGNEDLPDRARTGRGFDVRGPEAKQALGRRSKADNPVAYALLQAQQAIVRAEKNRVDKTLYRFIQAYPDPNLYQVYKGETRRRLNPSTGLVEDHFVNPAFVNNDRVHGVKIGGKQYYMELKDPGLARAMRGTQGEAPNAILRGMMRLARLYSSLLTSYNPEFVVSNFFRDMETALINVTDVADKPEKVRRQIVRDALSLKSIRGVFNALRGDGNAEFAKWFEEYRQAGGKISFMENNDVEKIQNDITKSLKHGRFRRVTSKAFEFIDDLNAAVENGVRLSTYAAMRKAGINQDRAAFVARELTVNFNRKGEWSSGINALYLFFNASTQGTARLAQAVAKSKAVRYTVASIFGVGLALDLLNYMVAGDDDDGKNAYDKIPEWIKERNLIIMIPGSKKHDYVQIPLAYGYNVPFLAGQQVSSVMRGATTPTKAVVTIGKNAFDVFNPLGSAASLGQFVAPTMLDPFMQVIENKNWYGGKIFPNKRDKNLPDSENYFSSASPWFVDAAKYLNRLTGGNSARAGTLDISPEVIEHFFEFATGGVGKFIGNAVASGQRVVNGEEWLPEKTPFLRRVYGKATTTSRRRDFFEAWDKVDAAKYEVDNLIKGLRNGKSGRDEVQEAREKHAVELKAWGQMQAVQKQLSGTRKQRDVIQLDRTLSDAEKRQRIETIEARENGAILRALGALNRAKKEAGHKTVD